MYKQIPGLTFYQVALKKEDRLITMNTVVRTNNDFNFLVTSHSAVKSTERLLMPTLSIFLSR